MGSIVGEKQRNATGIEFIDNIIGKEGIKTDVAIKLAPVTIPIIIVSVMVAVVAGIVIAAAIQKAVKN